MTNLKFEIFYNDQEPVNEYQPKVGQKMARIFWKGNKNYTTVVENHDEYGEYIVVPNYLRRGNRISDRSFTHRAKDFVDSVNNGDADVMVAINLFGRSEDALYFLDREIGESLRQKSIDGWKDTEFDVAVIKPNRFGGSYLLENNHLAPVFFGADEKTRYFSSEDEAEKAIDDIYDKAEK